MCVPFRLPRSDRMAGQKNKKTDHKQKPKGRNVAVIRCKLFALLEEMDEPRRSAIDLRPASHVFVSFLFFYFYYISFCFGRRERESWSLFEWRGRPHPIDWWPLAYCCCSLNSHSQNIKYFVPRRTVAGGSLPLVGVFWIRVKWFKTSRSAMHDVPQD